MVITRRSMLKGTAAVAFSGVQGLLAPRAEANALRVGATAPSLSMTTLEGERIATSDLLGRVVVLTFWATWCVPCREELPLLSDYAKRHAAAGLSVLGLSLDGIEQLPQVRAVARSLSFPVGLLAAASLPGYGRIWRIPVNFTIDRQGRLVNDGWKEKQPGWTAERLERIVTPLLEGKA